MRARWAFPALVLWACGGSEKKETVPSEPEGQPEHGRGPQVDEEEDPQDIEVQGLLGRLEPSQIQPVIEMRWRSIEECYRDNSGKNRFIGGHMELKFRVNRDGTVKQVWVMDGDLGAWPVEKCVLEVCKGMTFPKPKGGEAEFQFPVDFPARQSSVSLAESGSDAELQPKWPALEECKEDGFEVPRVRISVYVGPGGVVKSAGFVTPDGPLDQAWADCVHQKALSWKLTDPRGKVVKATSWYQP